MILAIMHGWVIGLIWQQAVTILCKLFGFIQLGIFKKCIVGHGYRTYEARPTIEEAAFEEVAPDEEEWRIEHHYPRISVFALGLFICY